MRSSLLGLLVEPVTKAPLELEDAVTDGDEIVGGRLVAREGREYPIVRGIPRFTEIADAGQQQTGDSFGFKWRQREAYDRPETLEWARGWLVDRYGFTTAQEFRAHLAAKRRVLDAGCGAGYSSALWLEPGWTGGRSAEWIGVDISEAIDVARDRLAGVEGLHFVQADVLALPFRDGTFGAAIAEGVLHHTPSTADAFASLVAVLQEGGEALTYVYRRKGPIREFADDYVRNVVAPLPPDEALERLRPLTELGRALTGVHATVTVTADVPDLGIDAGEYDLQRFVYWHLLKVFWNDAFSFEGNNLVNFDWYHPRYAHRHTEGELREWCRALGVAIDRLDVQESGFTLRGTKGRAERERGPVRVGQAVER